MSNIFFKDNNNQHFIVGVDEVGRGPLAGPVIAAAVVLDINKPIFGLADSKKLSQKKRNHIFHEILEKSHCYAVGRAEVEEIDDINIFQASLLAMRRAVLSLPIKPTIVLVDGTHSPKMDIPTKSIIRGDQFIQSISAASIVAKVIRDKEMDELDCVYPGYGFIDNKGYPTPHHLNQLNKLGAIIIHRKSFAPVRKVIDAFK